MDVRSWSIRARSRTPAQALALLRAMPGGLNVSALFPFGGKPYASVPNEVLNERIARAPAEVVGLGDSRASLAQTWGSLRAIQHTVARARVEAFLKSPGLVRRGTLHAAAGTPVDLPVVVSWAGGFYIHDGHHRLTAAKLLGEASHPVRLVDLSDLPGGAASSARR